MCVCAHVCVLLYAYMHRCASVRTCMSVCGKVSVTRRSVACSVCDYDPQLKTALLTFKVESFEDTSEIFVVLFHINVLFHTFEKSV